MGVNGRHSGSHGHRHSGDDGADVRFEKVSPHPGHIPHIIAHVIGDHRRVSGVILRYSRLHLPYQVGPHIGPFGVDSSPHPGE